MALKSALFRGDTKLEAAAVSHPAHITPGASGEHVGKIQSALRKLDGAVIDGKELASQTYGPSTANAVLQYKTKRNIINRTYQKQADNIVGIMTIAALDKEIQDWHESNPLVRTTVHCKLVSRPRVANT
jgi:peptidoglycan hydrolase-like protein with peptidoglycan-binding domain